MRLAETHIPDLILLDISMPVMDGLEAMRRLRNHVGTAEIPIIVITAENSRENRKRALAAGCDTFLVKPCALRRVLDEVERHIGRAVLRAT